MKPCPKISECIRLAICTGSSLEMQPCPKISESIRFAICIGSSLDLGNLGISPTSFKSNFSIFIISKSWHVVFSGLVMIAATCHDMPR